VSSSQRFTPLLIDAARPCRHSVGDRWFVDETYVKVADVSRYVYRAVDQYGQVIDVYVSKRRNLTAARTFFAPVDLSTRQRRPSCGSSSVRREPFLWSSDHPDLRVRGRSRRTVRSRQILRDET
jgi:hypothetical protein